MEENYKMPGTAENALSPKVPEATRLESALANHMKVLNSLSGSPLMMGLSKAAQQSTPLPTLLPNPGVKTNELLGQMVKQNNVLVQEIVNQKELLISQSEVMELMVQGMRVLSSDLATLIGRVSIDERPMLDDDLGDESTGA